MATYIKTLKEDNGDITYPQTLASAVLTNGGSDVEAQLATKASSADLANKITKGAADVQTADIASSAVTEAKIASNAVTTAKIKDANVTAAKLASNAVTTAKIADAAVSFAKLGDDTKVEVIGTTTGDAANCAWKFPDGRLINFQRYRVTGNNTTAWGGCYSGTYNTPKNYAVAFAAMPIVIAQLSCHTGVNGNCWLAQRSESGVATTAKPSGYQIVRPTSMSNMTEFIDLIAYGFWK